MRLTASWAVSTLLTVASARFVMYADEWHPTRPINAQDRAGIDHVVLAFAAANNTVGYSPKVPISTYRSEFPNAKIMIAVGGWGDDIGYNTISKSDSSIQQFASDINTMLTNTGADGVDIDWEYPGGNGADYKQVSNSDKSYQIEAYPKVLAAIRGAIGPNKLLSIAVPGKKGDMIGFTSDTGPKIWPSIDYVNVMSYDLINRRDTKTQHHTSVVGSADAIKNYLDIGAPASKINLGFAYYAKYFTTQGDCSDHPLGCPIVPAEDPNTGKDLLTSGAWTFEKQHMAPVDVSALAISTDGTYADVAGSWQNAAKYGVTDEKAGGQYYFDPENRLFWTWDTPDLIDRKFSDIVNKYKLGGVMAWSLGEDSNDWSHIRRMAENLQKTPSKPDNENVPNPPASKEPEPKPPVKNNAQPPSNTYEAPPSPPAPTTPQSPNDNESWHNPPGNPAFVSNGVSYTVICQTVPVQKGDSAPTQAPQDTVQAAAPTVAPVPAPAPAPAPAQPQYDDGSWSPTKYDKPNSGSGKLPGTTEQVASYVDSGPAQEKPQDGKACRKRRVKKNAEKKKRLAGWES
ncbi:hypothetical protein E8E13_011464 [Curvularia kusanoi]|uniref:chitinase n=1 Tax=Curvularia kusanoi TaxID=90978 RepID=A0A9P4TQG4_CURKU|nr:hypothetical protein E8E13_011464 [Curvularia kusanoi]